MGFCKKDLHTSSGQEDVDCHCLIRDYLPSLLSQFECLYQPDDYSDSILSGPTMEVSIPIDWPVLTGLGAVCEIKGSRCVCVCVCVCVFIKP